MRALEKASMLATDITKRTSETSAPPPRGARIEPELVDPAPTSSKAIRLPFFHGKEQGQGLSRIVYSIDLSNEILEELKSRGEKGPVALDNMFGVLFPQVLNGGNFYFNESWVAGLPASSATERWAWYTPLVVPLPSHLIRTDGRPNTLTVSQSTQESYISITQPYFGTTEELRRVNSVLNFFGVTLATAFNALCLVAGIFLLGVWTVSPKQSVYATAGTASVLWAVLSTLIRWNQIDMDLYRAWSWTIYSLENGLVCTMTMLVLSFVGQPLGKWWRNALFSLACLSPILFAIVGRPTETYINMLSMPVLLMFYVYASSQLVKYCIRVRDFSAYVLLMQSVLCLTLVLHDIMILTGLIHLFERQSAELTWSGLLFDNLYLSHLGMPLLLSVMGHIFLSQHKNNIADVESRDSFVETSLLECESKFAEIHQQMDLVARSEATAIERERIYQDVHDGIGSQLIKALFTLRNSGPAYASVSHNLQACLRDLRLVINADFDSVVSVEDAVFAFCLTQERHLEGSGLTVSYDVGVESTMYSDPKITLNVLRILQETLTNTIKHSDASDVFVEMKVDNSDLLLFITEHGRNRSISRSDKRSSPYGRSDKKGIASLTKRAAALGGKYAINIAGSGTQVSLAIPLPKNFPSVSIG